MMKNIRRLIGGTLGLNALLIILGVFTTGIVLAASTSKTLSTNYTLVNLSDSTEAAVTADYYKPDGSNWDADNANESFTIAPNYGQKIIAQYFDSTMTSGEGSAVISSSAPLGAVVQIQARNQTPTMGAYSGFINGSEKYYAPIILRQRNTASGLTNSQIIIQNIDPTSSNAVVVDFVAGPGSGFANWQKTGINIPSNSTYFYDIADESSSNLPDGWYGSAVISCETGKQIAVVVNIFAGEDGLQTYNAFAQENVSSAWSIPQFTSRLDNGLSMPISAQNLSGSEIAVGNLVLNCTSTISSPATFQASNGNAIPNNASFAFNPVTDFTLPNNWSGACRLTAPGDIVVYVQLRKPNVTEEFAAYEAFDANSTDTTVVIPLVSKRQPNGFATAVIIQNLDVNNTADVKLTYVPSSDYVSGGGSGSSIVLNRTIAAGGNLIQNHRLPSAVSELPNGWYGTLIVEPQSEATARPIVGYVQLTNYLGAPGDTFMAHNAFSLP